MLNRYDRGIDNRTAHLVELARVHFTTLPGIAFYTLCIPLPSAQKADLYSVSGGLFQGPPGDSRCVEGSRCPGAV